MAQHSGSSSSSSSSVKRASASKGWSRQSRQTQARAALARATAGVSLGLPLEPLEPRRLLAVNFTVNIVDPGGNNQQYYDDITRIVNAAGDDWGKFFDSNASIELDVEFENAGTRGFLAKAGSNVVEPIDEEGDLTIVEVGAAHEIRTEFDPNGGDADGTVTFNTALIDLFFWDPDPSTRTAAIPQDEYDAYSIVLHEIGHVVGFGGFMNDFTGELDDFATTYDRLITFTGTDFLFTGATATRVYGTAVPLRFGSIAHYGNPDGPGQDLDELLMSAEIGTAERLSISEIDLAILADIGLPVILDPDTGPPPLKGPILSVSGTHRNDIIEIIYTGNKFLVNVTYNIKVERFDFFTGTFILVDEPQTTRYVFDSAPFTEFVVDGEDGHDRIIVNNDMISCTILGGNGNDSVSGGNGNDTISGGAGRDRLSGGGGNDRVDGGGADDVLFGGLGLDRMFGSSGNDVIDGSADGDQIMGGSGNDILMGADGNDFLSGEDGNDLLAGGKDKDRLHGGGGADQFEGGAGGDSADFMDRLENLYLTLNEIADDGAAGEGDNILGSCENILGGLGDDRISGNGHINVLAGSHGRDSIDGGGGNDLLEGGDGPDVLNGMSGNDTLDGGGGNDRLLGGSDADHIIAGSGNDILMSADRSIDTLDGGLGNDTTQADSRDLLAATESDSVVVIP